MVYRRCGESGIQLPVISLGLWNNFGGLQSMSAIREMLFLAFDHGICHFDLANNYGPPPGSAEENFGRVMASDLRPYRDELIISTKAGYYMWPGPYGEWGSRKYLLSSLDQSLRRMGLDYVDIFYSHRFDPKTPLEETMGALASAVKQGKALYVGISSYPPEETARAARLLREMGAPCLIHQPSYSLFNRWIEKGLLDELERSGMGCIVFSPLAQGLLTNRYLGGIPEDARAKTAPEFFSKKFLREENMRRVSALDAIARKRGQTLAQLAIVWTLRDKRVTSSLIGASRAEQLAENIAALKRLEISPEELAEIEPLAVEGALNIWSSE